MQKRSRVWHAVILGCGLSVLGTLTLPEIAAASTVRIWSFSPKASILRNGVSKPARFLMMLEAEDLVKPEMGRVLEVLCSDNQIRTVQSGVFSGLGTICPLSSSNRITPNTFESRGNNCSSIAPNVLAPESDKLIATTAAYPTFQFLVPTTSASQAEFVLKGSDRKAIYRQTFVLSGQSGILRVALPTDGSISELIVGQSYKWEFNIICNPENRGSDDFVVGKVQRVPLVDAESPSQLSLWESYRAFQSDALRVLDLLRHQMGNLKFLPAIKLSPPKSQ